MRFFAAVWSAVYYLVAIATLSALIHFGLVLLIPLVASRDAYASLSEAGKPGETVLLPKAAPSLRRLPYTDPAVAMAFCRYDLSQGPVRIKAPLGRAPFTSVSFHSRRGAVFYALTDRAATRAVIEAVIVTPTQLRELDAAEDEDNPSRDLRIVSPTNDGYALRRVLSETPGLYGAAEDEAKTLSCTSEPASK